MNTKSIPSSSQKPPKQPSNVAPTTSKSNSQQQQQSPKFFPQSAKSQKNTAAQQPVQTQKTESTSPQSRQQQKNFAQKPTNSHTSTYAGLDVSIQSQRIIFLFLNLIGQVVEVQTRDNRLYEGLFHTYSPDEKRPNSWSIILKAVRPKNMSAGEQQLPIDTLIIRDYDVVQISAINAIFATEKEQYREEAFSTDSEITKKKSIVERELVPWQPTADDNAMDIALEEMEYDPGWDQYKVNEKFGVQTTYREELYTTELDKSSPHYKALEARANRIAKEMEDHISSNPDYQNIHLLEERGQEMDYELTEEELYSSVARTEPLTASGGPKKYVPPALKKQVESRTGQKTKLESKPFAIPKSTLEIDTSRSSSSSVGSPSEGEFSLERMKNFRQHLVKSNKIGSPVMSPAGTPHSPKSPLMSSPMFGDTGRVSALGLDPAVPKISDEVAREYQEYKLKEKKKEQKLREIESFRSFSQSFSSSITTKQPPKLSILGALKSRKAALETPEKEPTEKPEPERVPEKVEKPVEKPVEKVEKPTEKPAEKPTEKPVKAPEPAKKETQKETPKEQKKPETQPAEQKPAPAVPATPEKKPGSPEKTELKTPEKKTFTLNPNAKEFKFNPNAREFKPKITVPKSTASPPPQSSSWASLVKIDTSRPINEMYYEQMKIKQDSLDPKSVNYVWPGVGKSYRDEANMHPMFAPVAPQGFMASPQYVPFIPPAPISGQQVTTQPASMMPYSTYNPRPAPFIPPYHQPYAGFVPLQPIYGQAPPNLAQSASAPTPSGTKHTFAPSSFAPAQYPSQ